MLLYHNFSNLADNSTDIWARCAGNFNAKAVLSHKKDLFTQLDIFLLSDDCNLLVRNMPIQVEICAIDIAVADLSLPQCWSSPSTGAPSTPPRTCSSPLPNWRWWRAPRRQCSWRRTLGRQFRDNAYRSSCEITELRKFLCTWFGEVCSCCCLSFLLQLACNILASTSKEIISALYLLEWKFTVFYIINSFYLCTMVNSGGWLKILSTQWGKPGSSISASWLCEIMFKYFPIVSLKRI